MTPDQIYHRLCDKDVLKSRAGRRVRKTSDVKPDAQGFAKGRAADGTPIRAKVAGKSLAKMIREQKRKGVSNGA